MLLRDDRTSASAMEVSDGGALALSEPSHQSKWDSLHYAIVCKQKCVTGPHAVVMVLVIGSEFGCRHFFHHG
eukprot:scaffold1299_cov117-Skeletonema_dohrnii-CCMP3373.AAC.3